MSSATAPLANISTSVTKVVATEGGFRTASSQEGLERARARQSAPQAKYNQADTVESEAQALNEHPRTGATIA
jgi:hypothetical protein